ncbi:MAG: S4 domain-containing protein [Aliidongia sp.]
MSGVQSIEVREDDADMRLDRWFRRHFPGLSHVQLEKMLRTGQVRVDGGRVKAAHRLVAGMVVRVPPLDDRAARDPRGAAASTARCGPPAGARERCRKAAGAGALSRQGRDCHQQAA